MPNLKNSFIGLLLAFQFFTSLPIRNSLSMNQQTVTSMYSMMPILGLLMGSTIVILNTINDQYIQFSSLLVAILIVVAGIVMTGGLHLDGWIDMGDAYFSYQDRARRLEILDDSRVGAFGAISLVVLLLLKIGFIYEIVNSEGSSTIAYYFLIIPFLSRMALLLYFLTTHNVKEKGLAAYFKSQVQPTKLWSVIVLYTLLFVLVTYYLSNIYGLILYICMVLFVLVYRKWTIKNFGGMTGDLLGALYEGTEVFLWGMKLLFI